MRRWYKCCSFAWETIFFFFGLKYLKIISTCDISRKSWLTRTNPPSKSLMASARESMVSMSRWLVGSSSNNMCGFCQASQANITRHLCPSERFFIGTIWNFIMTTISFHKPHLLHITHINKRLMGHMKRPEKQPHEKTNGPWAKSLTWGRFLHVFNIILEIRY